MNEVEEVLEAVRLGVFLAAAGITGRLWLRDRSRPTRYLFAAFLAIALALTIGLLPWPVTRSVLSRLLAPLLLMALPSMLAAFAWSFAGPLPSWLRMLLGLSFVPPVVLAVRPLAPLDDRGTADGLLLGVYLGVWTMLAILAAVRLWRAPGGTSALTSRLRVLAVGILVLNLALFTAVFPRVPGGLWTSMVIPIVSAMLFVTTFAAPDWVRRLWRAETSDLFADVQRALISAHTPAEVFAGALPRFSQLLGADLAVLDGDGRIRATHGLSTEEQRLLRERFAADPALDRRYHVAAAGDLSLVLRPSRYAPLFGAEDRRLADGLALHLRAALERAQLTQAERRSRAAAERARQELESTVIGLAHDLRNPTVSLAGFAHLLSTTEDADERAEMAGHLEASARYIERLVQALLEVSRIGRTQTEREPVPLRPLVQQVADRWLHDHPLAKVRISELPVVDMNPVRLEQLLDNLIGNALRHAGRPDVTVLVTADVADDEFALTVSDDGQGVPVADREIVFQLFNRGATASEGTGVGLNLVQRIAGSYGGVAQIADTRTGATIVVRLPAQLVVQPA